MTTEDSLKRKSSDIQLENADELVSEPQTKVQKIDEEIPEPNLIKNDAEKNDSNGILLDDNVINECLGEKEVTEKEPEESIQSLPCSISVKFNDHSMMDKYKEKFLRFLESFIEFQIKVQDDYSIDIYRDENLDSDEWVVIDENEIESSSSVIETTTITKTVETHTETDDVLIIDDPSAALTPSKKRKKRSKVKKELFVVDATPSPTAARTDLRYTTKFTINTEKVTEENSIDQSAKQTCFNCNQPHSLRDCSLPKDYKKINLARQKFRQQQQPKTSRYHMEEEQKYGHLVPGKLSGELRKALGLYKNEAPHYIYMMRKLGYPPGWLEEAKFVHSNLEMFGVDGDVKNTSLQKKGLDPTKIVEFPGFNVPFEKGIKDEYRRYGVRPYSDDFSKEAMISFFDKKFAQEEDNLETCDMEIDQEQESTCSQEKEVEVAIAKQDDEDGECRDSPSLLELEKQKQQLLEELKDETKEEKLEKDLLCVKNTHFGTPVLKSNSPYSTLPHPDKFSKDVSPVINFENLPNSTGKYEQMTDVLQKVRSTLKRINSNT